MTSAAIYLYGIIGIDRPESIKTVKYNDERALIKELKRLQDGYCQDTRPGTLPAFFNRLYI